MPALSLTPGIVTLLLCLPHPTYSHIVDMDLEHVQANGVIKGMDLNM